MTEVLPPSNQPSVIPAQNKLRFWGILDFFYGALILWLTLNFIPKDHFYPTLLGVFGLIYMISAFFVFQCRSWAWRFTRFLSYITLTLCVLLVGLCLASVFYWLEVYGILGWGVSIAGGLLISGILQILGLYPALKLKSLNAPELYDFFQVGGGKGRKIFFNFALIFPLLCIILGNRFAQIDEYAPLSEDQKNKATQVFRSVVEAPENTDVYMKELELSLRPIGTQEEQVFITLWVNGERVVRVSGMGNHLYKAFEHALESFRTHDKINGFTLEGGQFEVERISGFKAIPIEHEIVVSLSVNPGIDGLRRKSKGFNRTKLPDDLISADLFGLSPMVQGIPELRFGLNAKQVLSDLGSSGRLERIRTQHWIEREGDGLATDIFRANLKRDPSIYLTDEQSFKDKLLSKKTEYLNAAFLGADYIVNHQGKDGKFDYQYFPFQGKANEKAVSYSLARHAGAVYGLSQIYEYTPRQSWKNTADLAIQWLHSQTRAECQGTKKEAICIPSGNTAGLGDQALSAVAILKYTQKTKDRKWLNFAKGLLRFILDMQRGDGEFNQLFRTDTNAIEMEERTMFASEQAAFALVLAAKIWKEEDATLSQQYANAAKKALDYLTSQKYKDFLSRFFYAADHWTCLASLEAFELFPERQYLDFCLDYSRFLQRLQFQTHESNAMNVDFIGHYGFGYFSPPQAPATGGFSEAVMSTLTLAKKHKINDELLEDIYQQAYLGLDAMWHDQLRSDRAWRIPNFKQALGAFRRSTAESEVRIDFVQHCTSALSFAGQL